MNRPYLSLIQYAGRQCGWEFIEIVPNALYEARYKNVSFLMYDVDLGFNQASNANIANSKSLTSASLLRAGVPCVEHIFLLNPRSPFASENTHEKTVEIYNMYGPCLVIKPDDGKQGDHVMKCKSFKQFQDGLHSLFLKNRNVVVSPFYDANQEYRVVILNEEVKLAFIKERLHSWKHNLTGGFAAVKEIDSLPESKIQKIYSIAIQASKALELTFCTVDILETVEGYKVLEVNASVYLSEYMKTSELAKEKVFHLFKDAFSYKLRSFN